MLMYLNQGWNKYFNEFCEIFNNHPCKNVHKNIKCLLNLFDLIFIILRHFENVLDVDR